jgi:hypothetical protein
MELDFQIDTGDHRLNDMADMDHAQMTVSETLQVQQMGTKRGA